MDNNQKYSPAPWRLHVDGVTIFDAEGQEVVDCAICGPKLTEDEQKANAKLIARAPSMAERLQLIEQAALNRIDGDSQPNDTQWGEIVGIACGDPNWLQHAKANYPAEHAKLVTICLSLLESITDQFERGDSDQSIAACMADQIEQELLPAMVIGEDGRTFLRSQGQPYPREEAAK